MPDHVYVIRQGTTRRYKVGFTNNVHRRLRTLQTGNAEVLSLVSFAEAPSCISARAAEHAVHQHLRRYRVSGGGTEWFELDDAKLASVIAALQQVLQTEADVERFKREIPDAPTTPPSRVLDAASVSSAASAASASAASAATRRP